MLRFTIRDVLLIAVIVGLALGWWLDHSRLSRDRQKVTALERLLQHVLNQYYADTGKHLQVGVDDLGISFKPTNVLPPVPDSPEP